MGLSHWWELMGPNDSSLSKLFLKIKKILSVLLIFRCTGSPPLPGLPPVVVCGLLIPVASLVAKHGL